MHRALTVPQTNNHMELFRNICSIRPTEAGVITFLQPKTKMAVVGYHSTHFECVFTPGHVAKPDQRSTFSTVTSF